MAENAETTAVATVDLGMLDAAVEEGGFRDPMNDIHTIKVYNPQIGTPVDETKAFTFAVKEGLTGDRTNWRDVITFNPIKVAYVWSGSIYPILEDGTTAKDKVFFSTSEFGKFAKKTDVIGLTANGKLVGSFTKGDFEALIHTPSLNGKINQFYERKTDKDKRPYDSTYLSKSAIIYGVIVGGERDGEHFRFLTSVKNLGTTWKPDIGAVDAEPGTFEAALQDALPALNSLLKNNGRKEVRSCSPDQTVLQLAVRVNERGNFLPEFRFFNILAALGKNNFDSIEFIESLLLEKFGSTFNNLVPAKVLLDKVNVVIETPLSLAPAKKESEQSALPTDAAFAENDPFAQEAEVSEAPAAPTHAPLRPEDVPF